MRIALAFLFISIKLAFYLITVTLAFACLSGSIGIRCDLLRGGHYNCYMAVMK